MASFEAADWSFKGPDWGDLREATRGAPIPCMELAPALTDRDGWHQLCRAWQQVPPHPSSVELVELDGDVAVLRYVAIDWSATALADRNELAKPEPFVVSRCLHLAELFQHVIATVEPEHWRWFQNPRIVIDLRGEPRVMWFPFDPADLFPEARNAWPQCTESMLVHVLGRAMRSLGLASTTKGPALLDRCLIGNAEQRISRLSKVASNLRFIQAIEPPARSRVWDLVEEGIGWYELDQLAFAGARFESALAIQPRNELADEGRALCGSWASLEGAKQFELDRRWTDALAAYRRARRSMDRLEYLVAIARCELGRGAWARAFDVAKRALQLAPQRPDVASIYAYTAQQYGYTRKPLLALQRAVLATPEQLPALIDALVQTVELAISKARVDEVQACAGTLLTALVEDPSRAELLGSLIVRISEVVPPNVAIELYERLEPLAADHATRVLQLLLRRLGASPNQQAVAVCERMFARSTADGIAAYAHVIEGRLRRGDVVDALALAERLLERAPDSGLAHYRRARCLFGLGRLFEARDELDRAQALDPMLVEAMVVRREVDRAIGKVKEAAGTQQPQQLSIPEHLGDVRIAMSRGKLDEAVWLLQALDPSDEAAQLLLGQLLIATKPDEAVVAFDRITGELVHRARIGKAKALALLDRNEEALRLLDRVCAEEPRLGDAMRARKALLSARDFVTTASTRG